MNEEVLSEKWDKINFHLFSSTIKDREYLGNINKLLKIQIKKFKSYEKTA